MGQAVVGTHCCGPGVRPISVAAAGEMRCSGQRLRDGIWPRSCGPRGFTRSMTVVAKAASELLRMELTPMIGLSLPAIFVVGCPR